MESFHSAVYSHPVSTCETEPLLQRSSGGREDDESNVARSSTSVFSGAVICILLTELCERLTFYSIFINLALFAGDNYQLNFTAVQASILSYVFTGCCYTLPVFGGWWADSRAGKFSVIFYGSIVYLVGVTLLPLGAFSKADKHTSWAATSFFTDRTFKAVVYISGLFLVAIGTGTIKSNVGPFGADQLSNQAQGAVQRFFNWFYWFISIGALIATTVVVWVQQYASYFYGYLIPTGTMIIAFAIFLRGKRSYKIRPAQGSAVSTALKISWQAFRNSLRRVLHNGKSVSHWLDRAQLDYGGSYSSKQVDHVKKLYRLLPVFGPFILYSTVYFQMNTSMFYQGEYMDIQIASGFSLPVATMSLLSIITVLVIMPIMEKLVYPKLFSCGVRLSRLHRIGIGMLFMAASMACAGMVELHRVNQCCQIQPRGTNNTPTNVSKALIFYQAPQYVLLGTSEIFVFAAGYEFAYAESPSSMLGVVMGAFLFTAGLGNWVGSLLLLIVNALSGASHSEDKWFPDKHHINQGKLAYFFFLLAALMLLNFVWFVFVAINFNAKKKAADRGETENLNSIGLTDDKETLNRSTSLP